MKIYGSCKPVDSFPAAALIDEFVGNDEASKMENRWKIVDDFHDNVLAFVIWK